MSSDTVFKALITTLAVLIVASLFYSTHLLVEMTSELDKLCQSVGMRRAEISTDGLPQQVCLDNKTRTFVEINSVNGKFILATYKD